PKRFSRINDIFMSEIDVLSSVFLFSYMVLFLKLFLVWIPACLANIVFYENSLLVAGMTE
ncbi:MAG: hypothetical protein LBP40_03310, partial [Campylobacteraceae bacterium]|nr:hypothetical protein [Campylobacteraceae bacterium]